MKLGLIGLGAIAPYFLDAIADDPGHDLVAACDLRAAKLAPLARSGVATFTSYEELLASTAVDAVIITLPNYLHALVAGAALAQGTHVCCEKPLTVSAADAQSLVALARDGGRVLFTAFHRRYNRHVERLANEVAAAGSPVVAVDARYEEDIAEHIGGESWYLDLDHCGGGCLIDNGPNALDAVRHVVGPLTLEDATIGDIRSGVEFLADVRLRTQEGAAVRVVLDWARPAGECKAISVELADGRTLSADMLDGFTAFKSSLAHEYAGIMAAFARAVESPAPHVDAGPATVVLVESAYDVARAKEERLRMPSKRPLAAHLVKLMFHTRQERGMALSPWGSRAIRAGDVHELVTTTDRPRRAGDRIDHVGFIGFAAFARPGLIERGDEVWVGDRRVGTVAGFDECHAPNHLNVVVDADRLCSAGELDAAVGQEVRFSEAAR